MNSAQRKDLFDEWSLYGPQEQRSMIDEYCHNVSEEECCKERFLEFLKDKLKIEDDWKKIGLT
jgi:hypothetical protein